MSIVFPKHKFDNGTPIDPKSINENFSELIQEINGNINEVNVKSNSATVSEGALCRTTKVFEAAELNCPQGPIGPIFGDGRDTYQHYLPKTVSFASSTPKPFSGNQILSYNAGWTDIASVEIVSRECLLWVLGSLQQTYYVDGEEQLNGNVEKSASDSNNLDIKDRYRFLPGVQYCLAIDGSRVSETTIGGQETSNDQYGAAYSHFSSPFVTDFILPISQGKHKISLQARVPRANRSYPQFDPDHCGYVIASRELIILELT
ncbi:MAG: hypothetical protein Unbinned80contig1000_9 [Prokaryotic dsDNA virus sp.]|nr:MAG: hypothetical protein Unbinned80contig1000_9 [Prokaryotic dsDNA virus sp.]|tara:strand:- start:2331 stop:3113 length:783 start_codon:yes stop_codon:yes gene_type:complete